MDDLERSPRRPGVAFAAFLVPFSLMFAVVYFEFNNTFAGTGWQSGESAGAFVLVWVAAFIVGVVLRFVPGRQPWDSVASGLLAAATLGVVISTIALILVWVLFAQWAGSGV
ncbi:hypothetical protein [Actinokineospora xionganensis]|uniref:Uncharacterized protein n=1 Tax=Actinokineospora xionganensis TaxID=2684470 RepID=A0ABR7L3A1_9PSEU|nr:hypothetical protein [Actinokineospora xionganensis]MBC6447144.1 hypothetical protein [Actinokineospora xionganensis]